jgi:hypothetical protein
MYTDPIDLPRKNAPPALIEAEFEGRGTGVDHPDQRLCSCVVHRE